MIIVIAILLILILILLCILVIPFNIFLNLNFQNLKAQGYFKLTWLKIKLIKKDFPDKEKKKKKKKEEKKEKKEFDINKIPRIISLLYQSSPHLMRIFKAFLKSTNFDIFYLHLKMGLGSPYDTAITSGYLYALFSIINIYPPLCLQLEPDFKDVGIQAQVDIKIRIRLFWIVMELIRAITRKPVRSLINEIRKMRS